MVEKGCRGKEEEEEINFNRICERLYVEMMINIGL